MEQFYKQIGKSQQETAGMAMDMYDWSSSYRKFYAGNGKEPKDAKGVHGSQRVTTGPVHSGCFSRRFEPKVDTNIY